MGVDAFQRRKGKAPIVEKLRPVSGRIQKKPKADVSAKSLKTTIQEQLVQKFTSGQTSVLQQLGFGGRSVEDLKVDNLDDEMLLLLRQELQNPSTKPNTILRSAVLKARFSDTINKGVSGGDAAEPSRKRKRVDEILDSERKKRREEDELRSIELRLREKQEKEDRELKQACRESLREAARVKLNNMRISELNWPEDNFRVTREFDLLRRPGHTL